MALKKTIEQVMKAFDGLRSTNSSSKIKSAFIAANCLLQIAPDEHLSKTDKAELNKVTVDAIIIGTVITVLIINDNEYGLQEKFGNNYLYPLSFEDLSAPHAPTSTKNIQKLIAYIGLQAMKKEIPFNGTIDYRVFPLLKDAGIGPKHFACYKFNTDPKLMDTTKSLKRAAEQPKSNKPDGDGEVVTKHTKQLNGLGVFSCAGPGAGGKAPTEAVGTPSVSSPAKKTIPAPLDTSEVDLQLDPAVPHSP